MKNTSFLLYNDYYQDFKHWLQLNLKEKSVKENIEKHFNKKNALIIENGFDSQISDTVLENYEKEGGHFELLVSGAGLLIGAGYNHEVGAAGELKMGYSFDYTTGLPYIPGSSIKGVIRNAFPKIKYDKNAKVYSYNIDANDKKFHLNFAIEHAKACSIEQLLDELESKNFLTKVFDLGMYIKEPNLEKLYEIGLELFEGYNFVSGAEDKLPMVKRDVFFDAFPVHASRGGNLFGLDAVAKHTKITKNPIPLLFLTVMPEVTFRFYFDFKLGKHINRIQKLNLVQKLILIHGIGAKTNVGYGYFKRTSTVRIESDMQRMLNEPDNIDIKCIPFMKKGKQFFGKVEQIADGVVKIEFSVENSKVIIFRNQARLVATIVEGSDVVINVNADFDFKKLNCKILPIKVI